LYRNRIKVGDLTIHYVESGTTHRSAGTLVFLHGWGLSSRSFEPTLTQLQSQFHVVAIDLPGFGGSDEPNGFWGYEAYAEFIDRFLAQLGISDAHLVGQSTGGGIALCTAACFPKRIRSLVLFNSTGIPMKKNPSISNRLREIAQQFWQSGFSSEIRAIMQDSMRNAYKRPRYFFSSVKLPVKHDLRHLLHQIPIPVWLIWGDNDSMLPVEYARELKKHVKHAQVLVLPGAHHEWCFVYPKEFADLLKKHFRELI
jgi:pimeloyl-ACP methyl ester carboxylesterase